DNLVPAPSARPSTNGGETTLAELSRKRRPASLSPERPGYPAFAHDPGDRLSSLPLEHRPPWHQGKLVRPFDQRHAPTQRVEGSPIDALDALACARLREPQPEL